jgi:hypothetical protein
MDVLAMKPDSQERTEIGKPNFEQRKRGQGDFMEKDSRDYQDMPDFDTLVKLAKESPEQFEALRDILNQELIESAPESQRTRLRGLLFQIDGKRRTASNPMQSCVSIFEMMQDSLLKLHNSLNEVAGYPGPELARGPRSIEQRPVRKPGDEESAKPKSADILPFPS